MWRSTGLACPVSILRQLLGLASCLFAVSGPRLLLSELEMATRLVEPEEEGCGRESPWVADP